MKPPHQSLSVHILITPPTEHKYAYLRVRTQFQCELQVSSIYFHRPGFSMFPKKMSLNNSNCRMFPKNSFAVLDLTKKPNYDLTNKKTLESETF